MNAPSPLTRIAAGEAGAVEECMALHGGLVWSLARRWTRSREDAEDAVQEIFLELWKHASRYDPARAGEAAFVATLARRRLIDRHRRSQARGEDAWVPLPEFNEPAGSSGREVERGAEAVLASRVLDELPDAQRQAVILSTCHGLSHSEIAERVGAPLGTVKSHVRRGLSLVRERLLGRSSASSEVSS